MQIDQKKTNSCGSRKSTLECVNGRHPPSKTPVGDVLPWTCRSELGKWLAGNATTLTSRLCPERPEVLRSLRHYLCAQSQGHHAFDRLEERGVERGSAWRSSLKGRERAIVHHRNIGTVSKATLGTGWSAYELSRAHRYHPELNWTEHTLGLCRFSFGGPICMRTNLLFFLFSVGHNNWSCEMQLYYLEPVFKACIC